MAQFEYAVVSMVTNSVHIMVYVYWPNGSYTVEQRPFIIVLNWLASMGWELVSSAGTQTTMYWTLKRPIMVNPALG